MTTKEIIKKLATLLYKDKDVYNGNVLFDLTGYEEDDFYAPYITNDNKILYVTEFFVNEEGTFVDITLENDNHIKIDIDEIDDETFECLSYHLSLKSLLSSVYNETDYPNEIGDFETDFLKI